MSQIDEVLPGIRAVRKRETATVSTRDAVIAATRFGLGPKGPELARAASDPRGWLLNQLRDAAPPAALKGLRPGHETLAEFIRAIRATKDRDARMEIRRTARRVYLAEAVARTRVQIVSDNPFRERLVAFWSNHFTVSARKAPMFSIAGAFEREAIRPHVTGRFGDMLKAVVRHPAMLVYLDNAQSIGPNSRASTLR